MSCPSSQNEEFNTLEFEDCFYQGYCYNNLPNGKGIIVYKNGDCYYGEIEENAMNGKGYFFPVMGGVIEGQFENHFANGFCTLIFANGDKYQGFLRNGQMHGKGIFYSAGSNSWKYCQYEKGEPIVELYSGEGELLNIELNIETDGLMISNLKSAEELNKNEIYEGELENGVKQGLGVLSLKDQSKKLGIWYNNLLDGLGVEYNNSSGLLSVGQFQVISLSSPVVLKFAKCSLKEGKLHGFGRRLEPNGLIYIGNFESGEYHGEGVLIDSRRKKVNSGKFERGKLVSCDPNARNLNLDVQRGISFDLRKLFGDSLSSFSKHPERSPDCSEFLHKVEERIHSKVLLQDPPETSQSRAPNSGGREELKVAKKLKERIDHETEEAQALSPVSQSNKLIKIAQELLSELKDPSLNIWRKRSISTTTAEVGWLLSKDEPLARPILIGSRRPSSDSAQQSNIKATKTKTAPETQKSTANTSKDPTPIHTTGPKTEQRGRKQDLSLRKTANPRRNAENASENSNNSGSRDDSVGSSKVEFQPFQDKTNSSRSETPQKKDDFLFQLSDQKSEGVNPLSARKFEFNPDDSPLNQARSQTLLFTERSYPDENQVNLFGGIDSFGSLPRNIEEKSSELRADQSSKKELTEDECIVATTERQKQKYNSHLNEKAEQSNKNETTDQNLTSDDESLAEALNAIGSVKSINRKKTGLERAKSAQYTGSDQEIEGPKVLSLVTTPTTISGRQFESSAKKRLTPLKESQLFMYDTAHETNLRGQLTDRKESLGQLGQQDQEELIAEGIIMYGPRNPQKRNSGSSKKEQNKFIGELHLAAQISNSGTPEFIGYNLSDQGQIQLKEKESGNVDIVSKRNAQEGDQHKESQPAARQSPKTDSSIKFNDPRSKNIETDNSELKFYRDGIPKHCSTAGDTIPTETDNTSSPIKGLVNQNSPNSKLISEKIPSNSSAQEKQEKLETEAQNKAKDQGSTKQKLPVRFANKPNTTTQDKKQRSLTEEKNPTKNKGKAQKITAIPAPTKNSTKKTRPLSSSDKKTQQKPYQPAVSIPTIKINKAPPQQIEAPNQAVNRTKGIDRSYQGAGSQTARGLFIPVVQNEEFSPKGTDRLGAKHKLDSQMSSARTNLPSTRRTERTEGLQALQEAIGEIEEPITDLKPPSKRELDEGINESFNVARQQSNPKIILLHQMRGDSSRSGLETPTFTLTENWHHSPTHKTRSPSAVPLELVIQEVSDPAENRKPAKPTKSYGIVENDKPHNAKSEKGQPTHRKSKSQPKLQQKELINPFTSPRKLQDLEKMLDDVPKYIIEGPKLPTPTKHKSERREGARTCSPEKHQKNQEDDQKPSEKFSQQVAVQRSRYLPVGSMDNNQNASDLSDISAKKSSSVSKLDGRLSIGELLALDRDSELQRQQPMKGPRSENIFDFVKQKDLAAHTQTWNGLPTKADSSNNKLAPEITSSELVKVDPNFRIEHLSTCKEQDEYEEENFDELIRFRRYLKKGNWDASSPKYKEMAKKKAERNAVIAIDTYPIHHPCPLNGEDDGRRIRGYSPKMYQEVFGDMNQELLGAYRMPQTSHHHAHPHAALFRNEAPSKKPKTMTFDEIKERMASKKHNK